MQIVFCRTLGFHFTIRIIERAIVKPKEQYGDHSLVKNRHKRTVMILNLKQSFDIDNKQIHNSHKAGMQVR